MDQAQEAQRFQALREEYDKILKTARRKGPRGLILRIFSLRGLAYL